MNNHFEAINELYSVFSGDIELTALLGTTPTNIEGCDAVIRRTFSDVTLIDGSGLPWIEMGFIAGHGGTRNYLVIHGTMEINIYSPGFYIAGQMHNVIHRLLQDNFEDAQIVSAGQRSLPVAGVYCWSIRVKRIVKS